MRIWYVEVKSVKTIPRDSYAEPKLFGFGISTPQLQHPLQILQRVQLSSTLASSATLDRAQNFPVHYTYSSIRTLTATTYTMRPRSAIGFIKNKK